MNTRTLWVAASILALHCNLGCFSSTPMSAGGLKPTYAVYEIDVQRSLDTSGLRFRIAVINGVMEGTHDGEIWFVGKMINRDSRRSNESLGYDGLDFEQRRRLNVGATLKLTSTNTLLSSIFSSSDIALASLNNSPAVYSITLVKKCDARVEADQYTSISWGGSGVIAIPTRKSHERFSISKPACFDESDRVFSIGKVATADPEVAKQLAQAAAESDAAKARAARDRSRTELMLKLTREKVEEAHRLAQTSTWKRVEHPRIDHPPFEDELRNALCPETIALARIKHIKRVTSDRVESERTNNVDGSYSVTHESSMTLEFEDGRKEKLTVALGKLKIVEGIKAITIRADGCVDIEVRDSRVSRQDEIVSDIADVLKNHFTRQIENDAFELAGKQYPTD